jgi:hypothetical protein
LHVSHYRAATSHAVRHRPAKRCLGYESKDFGGGRPDRGDGGRAAGKCRRDRVAVQRRRVQRQQPFDVRAQRRAGRSQSRLRHPRQQPLPDRSPGAYAITAITGTFSNPANGIVNAAITGLVPINPANERDAVFDPLVPSSLSFIDYGPPSGSLIYNNLFFSDGSPIDCDFPFTGTFVDVFGVAFTVAGGYTVDLWGDGDMFGPGTTTYGVGVTDGTSLLAYQFAGVDASVPEPSSFALLGTGLLGVLAWRRSAATCGWSPDLREV